MEFTVESLRQFCLETGLDHGLGPRNMQMLLWLVQTCLRNRPTFYGDCWVQAVSETIF